MGLPQCAAWHFWRMRAHTKSCLKTSSPSLCVPVVVFFPAKNAKLSLINESQNSLTNSSTYLLKQYFCSLYACPLILASFCEFNSRERGIQVNYVSINYMDSENRPYELQNSYNGNFEYSNCWKDSAEACIVSDCKASQAQV